MPNVVAHEMGSTGDAERLHVSEDGTTLPAVDVLTGRGFLTGKSGSGKSTTCSVIAEEILDRGFTLLVIDTDGEYYPLKERYEILHAGGDRFADVQVDPGDAPDLARSALVDNVPVVLDVSGFDDDAVADELVERVVAELFALEKEHRKPFLLIVEEMQEYLPQTGGGDDLAALLERVAKRGRKRGLGVCGISQRPSSVDKDFITQCDWLVWHKLTWQNDVDVARKVLGQERAAVIQDFEPGEAFLLTDWDDTVRRVRFRQKRTPHAGATPGLDRYDRRGSGSVDSDLLRELGASEETISAVEERSRTPSADDDTGPDGEAAAVAEGEGIGDLQRTVSDQVESGDTGTRTSGGSSPGGSAETTPPQPEIGATGTVQSDRSGAEPPSADPPNHPREELEKPQPPARPGNRDGVAGNLLEFGELSLYLLRVLVYRIRRALYRVRTT